MGKNLEKIADAGREFGKAVKNYLKTYSRFITYPALAIYTLPTLRRINYERSHISKDKEDLYIQTDDDPFTEKENSRGIKDPIWSWFWNTIPGFLVSAAAFGYAGVKDLIDGYTTLAGASLPIFTNSLSTLYELKRAKKNQKLVYDGDLVLTEVKRDLKR